MRCETARRYCALFSVGWLVLLASGAARGDGVANDIRVEDAWIRWLPANLPGGGYMTLSNTGKASYVLTGASSPDYGDIGMHQSRSHDGMSEMRPVDTIVLAPRMTVRFAEGGYHLMLMQPRRSLHPGDMVTVVLHFGNGATINVPFLVRAG